jgi:hypothetical protein
MANLQELGSKPVLKVEPPGRQLGNWLAGYAEYTAANEAPESFHLWVGLGTIAGAAQRKVQLINPYFDVHSNLYVVLVAPPGTARKTTALKIGQRLLKKVPGIHFTTKAGSAAALVTQFANLPSKEHQSLTAYALEFGTFMGNGNNDMVDFVTDIYDGNPDWDKQTILRGMEKIPRPWFNMLGGTTPRWLGDHLPPTAVEGGFVARTIWVYNDRRKLSSPFPKETSRMRELREKLINDLTHISTLSGEFEFEPAAEKFYEDWYLDEKRFPEMPDERTGGYYERKHIHVLKLAMLLSLAEKDELTIAEKDLRAALALLEATEPGMIRAFSAVGKNTYSTDLDRIKAQIQSSPKGISRAAIFNKNIHALNRMQIEEVLSVLMQMGEIQSAPGGIYMKS